MASTLYISLLICCCCSETVLLLCSRSFWAVLAELKKKNDIPARRIARIAKLMTAICSPCPSPRCAITLAPAGATGVPLPLRVSSDFLKSYVLLCSDHRFAMVPEPPRAQLLRLAEEKLRSSV